VYQNVPLPGVVARFGGGYVGAQQAPQGKALGEESVRRFNLQPGDAAIVFGPFDQQPERYVREGATADALEAAGLEVIRIPSPTEWAADPNLAIPVITAALTNNPETKAIVYPGGQLLGNAPTYMQAAGKEPGEIIQIGFDTSPQIVQAFADGWVQLTADQQPFLQGYMPILSLCQQVVYGLAPIDVDTGAGFVTPENYEAVADLATEGLR
jgi:simple sugar transport system substrate-binding protein